MSTTTNTIPQQDTISKDELKGTIERLLNTIPEQEGSARRKIIISSATPMINETLDLTYLMDLLIPTEQD